MGIMTVAKIMISILISPYSSPDAYTHTYVHTHTYAHTHTYVHTYVCTHIRMHTHIHMHTHTYVCTHTKYKHTHACTSTPTHTLHTYIHTHAHAHIRMYTNAGQYKIFHPSIQYHVNTPVYRYFTVLNLQCSIAWNYAGSNVW